MKDFKALIVDDNAGARDTLSDIFGESGYGVTTAGTGADAIAAASKTAFDLAIIDIKLPDMDGLKLLEELKAIKADTLCIIVTGHASRDNAITALRSGAYDYFIKPLDIEAVLRRAEQGLSQISLARKFKESEEKFRSIFESSNDAMMLLDEKGFIDCNEATLKVFGFKSKEEFLGFHPGELSPPVQADGTDSVEAANERIAVAMRDGRNFFEWTHKGADGAAFPAEVMLSAMTLEGRTVIQATVRDITERKRAVEDLERLFNLSGSMVCIIGFDGRFKRVSPAFGETLGYTPEELLSRPVADFIHPDDRKKTLDARNEKLKKGVGIFDFENRYICRDGSFRWLSWTSRSVPDDGIILAMAYDITHRKEDERAFAALMAGTAESTGQEFFDGLVKGLSQWLAVECCAVSELVDGRVRCLSMIHEGEYLKDFEYDLVGSPCEKVSHGGYCVYERDITKLFPEDAILRDMKAEGYVGSLLKSKDGKAIGILNCVSLGPLKLPPRAKEVFSIMASRASAELERIKAAEALKGSEEMMRAISETAQDAIVIINNAGNVVYWNPSAVTIFGYKADEAIGMPFTELVVSENTRGPLMEKFNLFTESGKCPMLGRVVEMTAMRKDGSLFPIEHSISTIRLHGEFFSVGMMRDITERKEMEDVLRKGEAKLSLIYQTVGDTLAFLNVEPEEKYRFVSVNQAFLTATGLTKEMIVGKLIEEVIPEASVSMVRENYKKAISLKKVIRWEETSLYPAGLKIGDVSVAPVFNAKGECTNLVVSVHDITERKEAEENVKKEMEITRNLLQITEATARKEDLYELLDGIVESIGQIAGSDATLAYLADGGEGRLSPAGSSGLQNDTLPLFKTESIDLNIKAIREAFQRGPQLLEERSDEGICLWLREMSSIIVIPLEGRKAKLGVIVLAFKERVSQGGEGGFTEKYLGLLKGAGYYASIAVEKARYAKDAIDRAMELSRKIETIEVMNEIDKTILSTLDPGEIISISVNMIGRIVPCDRCTVRLIDRGKGVLTYAAGFGVDGAKEVASVPFNETSTMEVIETLRPQYLCNLGKDKGLLPFEDSLLKAGYPSHIRVPLVVKSKITGVLNLSSRRPAAFGPEDLATLEKLSAQIIVALENSRLVTDLENLLISTIKTLTETIDAKSPWTRGHSERVTSIALRIARDMGFKKERLRDLEIGGLLHDIGKIGTYEDILNKPGKLTDDEILELHKHPLKGVEILSNIRQFEHIIPVVRHHHESFDGTGYPDGIKGEDIPLEARILTVADSVDAMVSDRPYRKGLAMDVIFDELKKFSGVQFDPAVVRAFLKLSRDTKDGFPGNSGFDARG